MTEQPRPAPATAGARKNDVEDRAPRGLSVRVALYVVGTHVLLAFLSFIVVMLKSAT
ncbi:MULTISPECIES: DUF6126 family protein [Streptomyces]|uniref:Small hydrophobic protein n=1 Tax=Streptomyces olivaceiscleroticus TaxID=68245 RepID=A0ABN0ZWF0_9ACTN|nr:DUF6126 family protein [Streptomyces niger]